jgi:hypothetical protein
MLTHATTAGSNPVRHNEMFSHSYSAILYHSEKVQALWRTDPLPKEIYQSCE